MAKKCSHKNNKIFVTNQPFEYDRSRSHASVLVCSRPICIINAMEWVYFTTHETPYWGDHVNNNWTAEYPVVTDA